ncbi:hypothetical protein CPB86DRAFT_339188 [Serendipita vermifera]|nr:hypothetical protein CPB86DRAFT_339188 [Serendipita vermifera]
MSDPHVICETKAASDDERPFAGEFIHVYNSIAARRLVNINLIWQTPVVGITGQAFLFSIALAADSSRMSRIIASCLCIIITIMTVQLIVRHRLADEADRQWLSAFEAKYFAHYAKEMPITIRDKSGEKLTFNGVAHGPDEIRRRMATPPHMGLLNPLARFRSNRVWAWGMILMAAVALLIMLTSIFRNDLLTT